MDEERDIASRLRRLETPVAPSRAFTERLRYRLEGELTMTDHTISRPTSPVVTFPTRMAPPDTSRHIPTHSGRTVLSALGAAVCVLAVAAFYLIVVSQVAPPIRQGSTNTNYDLYTVAGSLTHIDPITLADFQKQPAESPLDALSSPTAASTDGSLLAIVETVEETDRITYRVAVIETASGAERTSIPWKYPIESLAFNDDGSRLGLVTLSGTIEAMPGWHVYDTGTGKLLSTKPINNQDDPPWRSVARQVDDPVAQRAYRLVVPRTWYVNTGEPFPYILIHDLLTGERVSRIELPEFRAGVVDEIDPYYSDFMSAMTLSPDGRELILVDATDGTVTLVDTVALQVDRAFQPQPEISRAGQLLAMIGLSPKSVAAKGVSSVVLAAGLSANGESLYLWDASPERVSAGGQVLATDRRGLQVIELVTGTILHQAFEDTQILDVVPTPDGNALYATVVTGYDNRGNPNAFALWRLNPDLTRTAKRAFTIEPHIVVATS